MASEATGELPELGRGELPELGRVNVRPITPIFQTMVIVTGNIIIAIAVWLGLKLGYPNHPDPPASFIVIEAAVIAVGLATSFSEYPGSWISSLVRRNHKPSRPMKWWLAKRSNYQRYVVYALSILVVIALVSLVLKTGGGVASPFVPFLSAPALFGPFVAKRGGAVMLLVCAVALAIGFIGVAHTSTQSEHPEAWVYGGVSVILIFTAGLISAARLDREGRLEEVIQKLLLQQ